MGPAYVHFVGREQEIQIFQEILKGPRGAQRVLFIQGDGGIGKTRLARRLLEEASRLGSAVVIVPEPIDVISTDYRHIDGLQAKIATELETLVGQQAFADFRKRPTSEQFHACLEALCRNQVVVLALDTFEHLHGDVAGDWVLSDDERGLQVPGLVCIAAGRLPCPNKSFIRQLQLSGFNVDEALSLYKAVLAEYRELFSEMTGGPDLGDVTQLINELTLKTRGHPLLLELAFKWLDLDVDRLKGLSESDFREALMLRAQQLGSEGLLDVGDLHISKPVFDALVCMSYLDRRFDPWFLERLIDDGFIELDTGPHAPSREAQMRGILDNLQKYFFVKVRERELAQDGQVMDIHLHDEMAHLVEKYLWPNWIGPKGKSRDDLARSVISWYEERIGEVSPTAVIETDDPRTELQDILRVEHLHYVLKHGVLQRKLGDPDLQHDDLQNTM